MSKGSRSKGNNSYTVQVRQKDLTDFEGENHGSGIGIGTPTKICWDFQLTEPTAHVETLKKGDLVRASIVPENGRVLIRSSSRPLGYVPPEETRKILEATKGKSGYLSGRVISKSDNNRNAVIHLCLI